MKPIKLLLIEDSEDDAFLLMRELSRSGYEARFERIDTAQAMQAALTNSQWDAVICDYVMPAFSAPQALQVLKSTGLDLPFIVVSGRMGEETAVAVMRSGAHDYLTKDNLARLVPAIEREIVEANNRRERRHAERLSLQLGHILDNSSNEIFLFDATTGKILQSNRSACSNLGYKMDELSELTLNQLQPEFNVQEFKAMLRTLESGEREEVVYETTQHRRDGSIYPIEVRLYLSTVELPPVFVAVVQDITERKHSEAAMYFLAEASTKLAATLDYNAIFESVATLAVPFLGELCTVDVVTEDGDIYRAAVKHSDAGKADFPDQIRTFIATPNHPVCQVIASKNTYYIQDFTRGNWSDDLSDPNYRKLISQYNIKSYMAVPIVLRNKVLGVISLLCANTDRLFNAADVRLAEELARRAAIAIENARLYSETQQALLLRDQFLSIAAHELKTPITALLGNTQLIKRRVQRGNNAFGERELRMLGVIEQQAQRLSRMVEALLDISRIRNGTLTLEREMVDLNALAHRIVNEIQPTLERHSLHITSPNLPLQIVGDSLRLEQVFQNLIHNAIKYSPQGGTVSVDITATDNLVVLSVTDKGIGIPAKAIPNLFHQFFRADNTAKHQIAGMGLGLFVVKEIIALHGGRVEVESIEGQGSTFRVYLPLAEEYTALAQQESEPESNNELPQDPDKLVKGNQWVPPTSYQDAAASVVTR